MFKMTIDTGNGAFRNEFGETDKEIKQLDPSSWELRRILKEVENSLEDGNTQGKIFDVNGNLVGEWSLTDD